MKILLTSTFIVICILFASCAVSKNYSPYKKYAPEVLQKDFTFLRQALEANHPSLYWYTPKDSMDGYFERYYRSIKDSMTEQQFVWRIMAPMVALVRCGHTSLGYSKGYVKWTTGRKFSSFPFYLKVWRDSMAITGSLFKKDSLLKTGTLITSINGLSNRQIIGTMFNYLPMDGYAANVNYQRLSSNFPRYLGNIYGLSRTYKVGYVDSLGQTQVATIPLFEIKRDTAMRDSMLPKIKQKRATPLPPSERRLRYRSFSIDSTQKLATLTLNSFTKGNLRRFFRKNFATLNKQNIPNLALDLRINGGGRVNLSTLLTKYISRSPFKVADTLYSKTKFTGKYTKHLQAGFFNNIAMFFMTKRKADGNFHMGYLERKLYKPKKKNHYDGNVYVLINGATFSASSVFCNAVKGQPGITLVGEETGGGWYGNNGILIPDLTLPRTKVRVRLPLFRLVQYNHVQQKGTGVPPDVYVGTSYESLLLNKDKKMEAVRAMIENK